MPRENEVFLEIEAIPDFRNALRASWKCEEGEECEADEGEEEDERRYLFS